MDSNTKKIAFASCQSAPPYAHLDDELLADYLRAKGFEVVTVVWNDLEVKWEDFALVLPRSTWDYHEQIEVWYAWLKTLEEKQVNIWNPVQTLQWNTHKSYLKELKEKGIEIVPTVFISKGTPSNLHELLTSNNWRKAVVKPAISLSAYDTWRTSIETADNQQADFEDLIGRKDVLVQQFMPEIKSVGEYSLMFFGGKFSHPVLKSNPTGNFRIQEEHGGISQLVEISPEIIQQAENLLQIVDCPIHYARVDVVLRNNQLILMELELIEPSLFFGLGENAVQILGDLITDFFKN